MSAGPDIRLLRRLGAPGARVARDGPDAWAVYPKGDRRRRALARLTEARRRELAASGVLAADGADYVLTQEGRALLTRLRAGEAPFQAQHAAIGARPAPDADGTGLKGAAQDTGRTVAVNLSESPLARLVGPAGGQAFLDAAEIQAGERLRGDMARSTYNARITMDWSAPPAGRTPRSGGRDPAGAPDGALAARERVNTALDFVGAPLSSVLLDVLWREIGLEALERQRGWPRRSGRLGVKLALARLAEHYGLGPRHS